MGDMMIISQNRFRVCYTTKKNCFCPNLNKSRRIKWFYFETDALIKPKTHLASLFFYAVQLLVLLFLLFCISQIVSTLFKPLCF